MSKTPRGIANRLLGYPAGARLLIINADDFGMYPAISAAIPPALRDGIATSTSLMVPCPGAAESIGWLRANPDVPFGVHLTVVRDSPGDRWGPLAPRNRVPSLLDDSGTYALHDGTHRLLPAVALGEVELEFRAQIEAVLSAGLRPTHLDWHSLLNGGRVDVFDLCLGLARDYGLALRVAVREMIDTVQAAGLPTADDDFLDSFSIPTADKPARYLQMLRDLPEGLSEWAVHPSTGEAASRVIDPEGWPVRCADYAFVMSKEARRVIDAEGIILLDYRPLQMVWRGT
ncbi:MAG: ChbG/HpnK family deacetylase [Anaerolineae bacterium]